MSLQAKKLIIAGLGAAFLVSLLFVQALEVTRKKAELGLAGAHIAVPDSSTECVDCHHETTPGIVDHWKGSTHAEKGVGCVECHQAHEKDADSYRHYGALIATVVTPRDCSRCHVEEAAQFAGSHHAAGGNILASLDNFLAEVAEGGRALDGSGSVFNPHSPTPGRAEITEVNGLASATLGCKQCHGSLVALQGTDGKSITFRDLAPDPETCRPTNLDAVARIVKNKDGRPLFDAATWPNTGIGRLNLDGSSGSCSACHSRHDFSPRRARRPENCGKCHLGPDHPQKEIYEESKHGVAYRDLSEFMNLDAKTWVLGRDYTQAPTCATCHMSGHTRNGGAVTHDPGIRISWTNRPPVSLLLDTDVNGKIVKEPDPEKRRALVKDGWEDKRTRMKEVCSHCHTPDYVNAFYKQYDDLIVLYNEKFAKPGAAIVAALREQKLLTPTDFDEKIEWTWFYLWHHEGRRARHGAAMMAPDYTHWHGMYEVADRFYTEFVPEARGIVAHAQAEGKTDEAAAVTAVIDGIMARHEHRWQDKGR